VKRSLLPKLVWNGDECKVEITIAFSNQVEYQAILAAERSLKMAGIFFDAYDGTEMFGTRVWNWGNALRGPIYVTFEGGK